MTTNLAARIQVSVYLLPGDVTAPKIALMVQMKKTVRHASLISFLVLQVTSASSARQGAMEGMTVEMPVTRMNVTAKISNVEIHLAAPRKTSSR